MQRNTASLGRPEFVLIGALTPLCLYLVLAPLLDNLNWLVISREGVGLFDWQRVLECWSIGVALLVGGGALCWWREQVTLSRGVAYVSCLVFGMGALSIILRGDLYREAWREWLLFLELWILGGVLKAAAAGMGNRLADIVVTVLTGGALCYLMLILVINHSINWMEIPFEQFSFIGFINIRMFSDWQGFLLPLFPLLLTQYCASRSSRLSVYLLGTLFYTLLFISGSRSVLLGLIVAHLVFAVSFRAKYIDMFLRSCAFLVSGAALYLLCKEYVLPQGTGFATFVGTAGLGGSSGRELTVQAMTNPSGRLELWGQAVDLAARGFPFGVGPGMFAAYPNSIAAAPHNALLSIAAEWGWIVAGISLYFVIRYFVFHLKRLNAELSSSASSILTSKQVDIQLSFLFSLLMLFAQSFVSTNVLLGPVVPICIVVGIAVIAGYQISAINSEVGASYQRKVRINRGWVCIAIAVSAGGFLTIISGDFASVGERNIAYRECSKPTAFFAPHFWAQGWLVNMCP